MALPDRDSLLTMNWSGNGSPFCHVAAKSGIDLDGLDWSMIGSPWWGLEVSGAPAGGDIEEIGGVEWTSIEKLSGVTRTDIQKVTGIDGK